MRSSASSCNLLLPLVLLVASYLLSRVFACQQALYTKEESLTNITSSLAIVNGHPAVAFIERGVQGTGLLRYLRSSDADGRSWPDLAEAVSWPDVSDASLVVINGVRRSPVIQSTACVHLSGESTFSVVYRRSKDANGIAWHSNQTVETVWKSSGLHCHLAMVQSATSTFITYHGQRMAEPNSALLISRALDEDGAEWVTLAVPVELQSVSSSCALPSIFSLAIVGQVPSIAYLDKDGFLSVSVAQDAEGRTWHSSEQLTDYRASTPVILPRSDGDKYMILAVSLEEPSRSQIILWECLALYLCDSTVLMEAIGTVVFMSAAWLKSGTPAGDVLAYQYVESVDGHDHVHLNSFELISRDTFKRPFYPDKEGIFGRFASVATHNTNVMTSWHGGAELGFGITLDSFVFSNDLYGSFSAHSPCEVMSGSSSTASTTTSTPKTSPTTAIETTSVASEVPSSTAGTPTAITTGADTSTSSAAMVSGSGSTSLFGVSSAAPTPLSAAPTTFSGTTVSASAFWTATDISTLPSLSSTIALTSLNLGRFTSTSDHLVLTTEGGSSTPLYIALGVLAVSLLLVGVILCVWFARRRRRAMFGQKATRTTASESHRSARASAYRRTELSRQSRSRSRRRSGAYQATHSIGLSPRASTSRKSFAKRTAADASNYASFALGGGADTYDVVPSTTNYARLPALDSTNGSDAPANVYDIVSMTKKENEYDSAFSPLGGTVDLTASNYDSVSSPFTQLGEVAH